MNRVKNDIFAGITAAVVALPLALAFGVASGAGAIAGLYGAIILGFFAALFGGTPTQISGPTGPMTVVFASAIAAFPNDFSTVMTIVFLAGLMQISFGIVGIGKWIKYIPYPVISGFMCGIGVIIIILQINPFLGVDSYTSIIYTVTHLLDTFGKINYEAVILATLTLIIMITVFLLTIFVDLIMAVGVGITISSIIAVYQVSRNTQIKIARSKVSFDIDIENNDIQIIKVYGSLFFGTASFLEDKLEKLKNSKKIIIDCKDVSFFDISAIFTLEEIIEKFRNKDFEIILVLRYRHKRKILSVDSGNVFKKIKIYSNLDDAINYTQKYQLVNNG